MCPWREKLEMERPNKNQKEVLIGAKKKITKTGRRKKNEKMKKFTWT